MDIASFLTQSAVLASCGAGSKKLVLQEVAKSAARQTGIGEREIFAALLERERLGSTAVGNGIAIPHARFRNLKKLTAFFLRLQTPINFDAPDGKPIDLLFVLLAPAEANSEHLRAMARVARLLRDVRACDKIRQAVTAEVIYNLLTAEDELES